MVSMRVLVACHGLWPKTPTGGMERETYNLCRELARRNIDVVCAVPSSQLDGNEPFPTLGVRWPKIKPWLLANYLFSNEIVKHLQLTTYDIALSMGFAMATWRSIDRTRLIFHSEALDAI